DPSVRDDADTSPFEWGGGQDDYSDRRHRIRWARLGDDIAARRTTLRQLMQRRSTMAFLLTLPLSVLILALVAYPAGYAIWISLLDRKMTRFVGLGNFEYLLGRDRFWLVLFNTTLFALSGVVLKALIGFAAAHFIDNIPARRQRKWRGMLLLPWVIPPAMGT